MNILFIGNGFDKAHSINIEFDDFINSDVFIKKMGTYKKFFTDSKYNDLYNSSKLWSRLEDFCYEITKKTNIKKKVFYNNLSEAFMEWFDREWSKRRKLKGPKNKYINKLIKKNMYYSIFSFNYTATATRYGYISAHNRYEDTWRAWTLESIKKRLINLHYCINKKNIFIIGSDKETKINKDYLIENWEKKEIINHKKNFLKLILKEKKINKIDFYGFSFGNSDVKIIFFVFNFLKRGGEVNIYDMYPDDIRKQLNTVLKWKRGKKECFERIKFIKTT